jgi:hypothetical protein
MPFKEEKWWFKKKKKKQNKNKNKKKKEKWLSIGIVFNQKVAERRKFKYEEHVPSILLVIPKIIKYVKCNDTIKQE